MNPFKLHFWKHAWSRWSAPYTVFIAGVGNREVQKRICDVCGKIEYRRLGA